MSKVLEETGCAVPSSDLYDRGYGEVDLDFLTSTRHADNIVSNPPFNCAEGFVASAVRHARKPSRVWVFSERITFYPTGATVTGTGTTAYAWFVWDKDAPGRTELKWFKPGYRARYS